MTGVDLEPSEGEVIAVADLTDLRETRLSGVSPDGGLWACLSNRSGLPQIWLSDSDGRNLRQVTDLPERVVQLAFAPKSRDLLFTTDVGMDERYQLWLLPEGSRRPRPLTIAPDVAHVWGAWSPDGTRLAFAANGRDPYAMDIAVMELATGTSATVLEGNRFQEVMAWTTDGEGLILRAARNGTADQELLMIDLKDGAVRPLLPKAGRVTYPALKTDKSGLGAFVLCDLGGAFHALHWLDFATDTATFLVGEEGHDIDAFALSPDQDRVALVVNSDGFSSLRLCDPDGGRSETVVLPFAGMATGLRYSGSQALLMTLEGPARPAAVWRYDLAEKRFTEVIGTVPGKVDLDALILPECRRFKSFDGTEVPYLVYTPKGRRPEAGWPVLFIVHGGPEAQWQPNFRADLQHYLSLGIMVIAPNVRGSTGYGRSYHEADDNEKRMDAVQDLLALARAVADWPEVDAGRLGVMGQSYGGFMVLAAMTEAPDLWRTGVDIYGISNFVTMMETTGPWRRALRAAEYGTAEDHGDLLRRISPVHRLDRMKAPLLIVHCTDDPRVPIEQGEQVYSRLRGLGRKTAILRIEHEGHGFSRICNKTRAFGVIADWVARTL